MSIYQISVISLGVYLLIGLFFGKYLLDTLEKLLVKQDSSSALHGKAEEWLASTENLIDSIGSIKYIIFVYLLSALLWLPLFLKNLSK